MDAALDEGELQQILAKARTGESHALGTLYDIYSPEIYRYLYRRTGNSDEAQDMTSSVFLKVLEAIESGHCWDQSFTGWLYRIAQNQLVDVVRLLARRPQTELPDNAPCPLAAEMEEDAIRHCTDADVRSALNELRPAYASVLTHRFSEDLTHAEVGRLLGKNADSVKVIQHRALKSLRSQLLAVH